MSNQQHDHYQQSLAEQAEEIYFSDKDVADMTEWEQKLYWMHKRIEDQRFEYSMDAADEWEVDDV